MSALEEPAAADAAPLGRGALHTGEGAFNARAKSATFPATRPARWLAAHHSWGPAPEMGRLGRGGGGAPAMVAERG